LSGYYCLSDLCNGGRRPCQLTVAERFTAGRFAGVCRARRLPSNKLQWMWTKNHEPLIFILDI